MVNCVKCYWIVEWDEDGRTFYGFVSMEVIFFLVRVLECGCFS